jgi:hypothetical protein
MLESPNWGFLCSFIKIKGGIGLADEYYLKYGGIKFSSNVSPRIINEFVSALPEEKKASLYLVAKELKDRGFITLHNGEFTTVAEELEYFL